jgi:hypothetical protein
MIRRLILIGKVKGLWPAAEAKASLNRRSVDGGRRETT